jgi:hypothetical protein
LRDWTTPESRNTPSPTNLEEEEIVDAPGNDGNASMTEQFKRPNPWRKMDNNNNNNKGDILNMESRSSDCTTGNGIC